jgi:type II secretory pathway pseudopilin PulG
MFGKKVYKNTSRGFTLIETIVSIGLLTLALGAFVSSVTASLKLTDLGNKRYLASKIAQEGAELFQSKRNNNVICIKNNATSPCSIPDAVYLGGEKDWRYGLYTPLPPLVPNNSRPPKSYEIDGNEPNSLLVGLTLPDFNSTHYLCQQSSLSGRFSYCGVPSQYIPGNFTREIKVSVDTTPPINVPATNIYSPLKVEIIVSWTNRSGTRLSLTIEKHLFYTQP